MSPEQIVAKARAFQVKMRRRRWLEFASLPFVVAVYVYASTFPGWVVKLGSLLSALAVANIVWQRHRRDVARRIPEALAAALADFHRAELVRHRDAVSRSMPREALPALSGAILIILGRLPSSFCGRNKSSARLHDLRVRSSRCLSGFYYPSAGSPPSGIPAAAANRRIGPLARRRTSSTMTVGTAMPNTGRRAPDDFRMQRQPRVSRRTCLGVAACLVLGLIGLVAPAQAQIVALGASNTRGIGVAFEEAFPAQLEAMLRAKGYRGRVLNAGISGDTTAGMLTRLDNAVPPDTRVVILQPGGNDLRRRGGGPAARDANIQQIVARLSARGIQVVMLDNDMLHAVPNEYRQADGEHLTPEGYRLLASWLVPKVAPLIGLPGG